MFGFFVSFYSFAIGEYIVALQDAQDAACDDWSYCTSSVFLWKLSVHIFYHQFFFFSINIVKLAVQ